MADVEVGQVPDELVPPRTHVSDFEADTVDVGPKLFHVEVVELRRTVEENLLDVLVTEERRRGQRRALVVRRGRVFDGIDAVIDKDHASALLAVGLGAERLVILTQVPGVYRDFGRDGGDGDPIAELGAERDAELPDRLPAGSMRPKVEAAFAFVTQTGGEALITSADAVRDGRAGTRVVAA